nr:EOG090X0C0Q [Eurycercus lamellatus]
MAAFIQKEDCTYTSCYCEENVWKICDGVRMNQPKFLDQFFAVFISNSHQSIPLWCQKAGNISEDGLVVWDYHVILVHKRDEESLVYDLDTVLPFPCPFLQYGRATLREDEALQSRFQRFFRVIPATEFLEVFSSDRSHMKREDGSWMKPPPTYPPIHCGPSTHNFPSFISMVRGCGPGVVMDYSEFIVHFS